MVIVPAGHINRKTRRANAKIQRQENKAKLKKTRALKEMLLFMEDVSRQAPMLDEDKEKIVKQLISKAINGKLTYKAIRNAFNV
jgi:hypothetical protein